VNEPARIRSKERDAVLQSLQAGVVPRRGQHHIQVGRVNEVKVLLDDIERVADGGATIRFIIGDYGSGKTFFLHLIRAIALEKRLVTAHADVTPDLRLHATGGQARALFAELMRNLSTRVKPDGGAMATVVERFVTSAIKQAEAHEVDPETVIQVRLDKLSDLTGGYDFAQVVARYWRAHDTGNDQLKAAAIRWLRGEYTTRTEARSALGVRTIIDDAGIYDHIKLMALFVRLSGYGGLLVCLDELVNLYKLASSRARNTNYEQILHILNDSLQGVSVGLGFLMCGTPEYLSDTRRGLYSYPALQGRLAENPFAVNGLVDFTGPVMRLANLTPEDVYVLLGKVRHVYASGDPTAYLLPDEGLRAFMEHCSKRIGDAYFRTPRSTIREFVSLLAVLAQNPNATWQKLIGQVNIEKESNPDLVPLPAEDSEDPDTEGRLPKEAAADQDDDLSSFRL
jgi:hypothetical protein